jgi:hypothetical protein
MPSHKPKPASPKATKTVALQPDRPQQADQLDAARRARTQEFLNAARRREAELTKRGYCF